MFAQWLTKIIIIIRGMTATLWNQVSHQTWYESGPSGDYHHTNLQQSHSLHRKIRIKKKKMFQEKANIYIFGKTDGCLSFKYKDILFCVHQEVPALPPKKQNKTTTMVMPMQATVVKREPGCWLLTQVLTSKYGKSFKTAQGGVKENTTSSLVLPRDQWTCGLLYDFKKIIFIFRMTPKGRWHRLATTCPLVSWFTIPPSPHPPPPPLHFPSTALLLNLQNQCLLIIFFRPDVQKMKSSFHTGNRKG